MAVSLDRLERQVARLSSRIEAFEATALADANINSSGDNQQEAFANCKELILDVFDRLSSLPQAKLGPGPARQIAVLREFMDGPDHKRARR